VGDVPRAIKLILRDRISTLERLKKEYRTLLRTPEHPNVVRVYDADVLPGGGPPFIVFEFVNGLDVGEMIEHSLLSAEETITLARQVAAGLVHLHRHGVYHCDIKPRNLLWTESGAKIIDFNVSVLAATDEGHGGGSRRYLPPDLDLSTEPTPADLADRDCYALGLTLYEAIAGRYPWETSVPPPGMPAPDPRELTGLADLTPELVAIVLKAIAPKRGDRFASAVELQTALDELKQVRSPAPVIKDTSSSWIETGFGASGGVPPANTNPFVSYLLTLHSQSSKNNSGTRGLDALGREIYVETALDRDLTTAALGGELSLVLITGNAGDGKTAFLQKLEGLAEERGAVLDRSVSNGCRFTFGGRTYLSNYDGSQDEGDQQSDDVLREFFAPFSGSDPATWPQNEVRLIAINEGRLVDYLAAERSRFEALAGVVERGLTSGMPENRVAVVNLNLRSVVADTPELPSILDRLLRRMTHEKFWQPCQNCDLADRCYALHNARTFQDDTAGLKVIDRLKALYTVTHLRGRLHITLRDLRSALAYMLTGTRTCAEIHSLYEAGRRNDIIDSFYFNSWMGGDAETPDRLLTLLKDVDVGQATDPRLDRALDFVSPDEDRTLFSFSQRGAYDRDVLRRMFEDLPRDFNSKSSTFRGGPHQRYLAIARRRAFFERRDTGWKTMLPYRTADRMLAIVQGREPLEDVLREILDGINRGESLVNPRVLAGSLAMQVREVENGTARSYRLFSADRFSLVVQDEATRARFVEHMPIALVLRYQGDKGGDAELVINLDVFEMLLRLNAGYRPSVEEEQGYCLSLAVFKNVLGSAPYQEVLLTTTGHDFYRVERKQDGRLEMNRLLMEVG
jgi:serine/threonine protein kinase